MAANDQRPRRCVLSLHLNGDSVAIPQNGKEQVFDLVVISSSRVGEAQPDSGEAPKKIAAAAIICGR